MLGPTFYAMVDDRLYLEAGGYKSLSDSMLKNVGLTADDNSNLDKFAPYWRAALQFSEGPHYFSVGMRGLNVTQKPEGASTTDKYNDFGVDATDQFVRDDGSNQGHRRWRIDHHQHRHGEARARYSPRSRAGVGSPRAPFPVHNRPATWGPLGTRLIGPGHTQR